MAVSEDSIRTLVVEWYRALDRHDELADVLPYLLDEGLEMRFPEVTARGHSGFIDWYKAVTNRFFDEEHTVTSVRFTRLDETGADLKVLVNWQAKIWNPPAARSEFLGFDAYQTWELVFTPDGGTKLKTYVVDRMEPMPGSASL
ncbi:nuclear transport factor 2 family protein [Actinoplanes sp. NPDC049681]|uniref:nuclear transport factor 2 family protein n=1 Tax=Actinoplanes sp. NPDC049681 TaxID=3363905 RepID=UPI0037AD4658